jgi:hypothetical protein
MRSIRSKGGEGQRAAPARTGLGDVIEQALGTEFACSISRRGSGWRVDPLVTTSVLVVEHGGEIQRGETAANVCSQNAEFDSLPRWMHAFDIDGTCL